MQMKGDRSKGFNIYYPPNMFVKIRIETSNYIRYVSLTYISNEFINGFVRQNNAEIEITVDIVLNKLVRWTGETWRYIEINISIWKIILKNYILRRKVN